MTISKEHIEAQRFIKNINGKTKFSISKNSRALGLSRQTYQNKLDGLRDQKIITNFSININPDIRPNNLKYVMLEIKTNPKEPELVEELLKIPQLRVLDGIFGEFSLFALFIFKSPEDYYTILNSIDNLMAKSYFKKYQIIETIKVFKTNGISLSNSTLSLEDQLVDKLTRALKHADVNDRIEIQLKSEINLNQISSKIVGVEYNPERFPGLILKIDDIKTRVIIFSEGKIVISDLRKITNKEQAIYKIIDSIKNIGINLDEIPVDPGFKIDDIDFKILNILRDGQGLKPISTYEIKEIFIKQLNLDISQSTIHNRIKKLEQQGVILNYTVNFSPKKLGFKGKYLLRVKPKDPSKYNDLALRLEANRNITDLFRIGEQYGLFAIVRVKETEDYRNFIRDLYNSEEIEDTFTNFVLDELVTYTNFVIFL
jgi:DNA-binding Lrp family transcriptional regulator